MDDGGADARDFVGADRRAHSAAANRHAALYPSGNHGLGERHDEVGIVVLGIQRMCAKIHCVARRPQVRDEFLFQAEPAVIRGDAHTHIRSLTPGACRWKCEVQAAVDMPAGGWTSLKPMSLRHIALTENPRRRGVCVRRRTTHYPGGPPE